MLAPGTGNANVESGDALGPGDAGDGDDPNSGAIVGPGEVLGLGEAPGRSDELSRAVSRLRESVADSFGRQESPDSVTQSFKHDIGLGDAAAQELTDYLHTAFAALGTLPTQEKIVFERFFDEAGGMQFVIHSPYGSRINRAWGLALRKRFCRKFNFELAAATEDNIVLSLTTAHSLISTTSRYLNAATVRTILVQALWTR